MKGLAITRTICAYASSPIRIRSPVELVAKVLDKGLHIIV